MGRRQPPSPPQDHNGSDDLADAFDHMNLNPSTNGHHSVQSWSSSDVLRLLSSHKGAEFLTTAYFSSIAREEAARRRPKGGSHGGGGGSGSGGGGGGGGGQTTYPEAVEPPNISKLRLLQALLIEFHVCPPYGQQPQGDEVPLPQSVKAATALIKATVYISIAAYLRAKARDGRAHGVIKRYPNRTKLRYALRNNSKLRVSKYTAKKEQLQALLVVL